MQFNFTALTGGNIEQPAGFAQTGSFLAQGQAGDFAQTLERLQAGLEGNASEPLKALGAQPRIQLASALALLSPTAIAPPTELSPVLLEVAPSATVKSATSRASSEEMPTETAQPQPEAEAEGTQTPEEHPQSSAGNVIAVNFVAKTRLPEAPSSPELEAPSPEAEQPSKQWSRFEPPQLSQRPIQPQIQEAAQVESPKASEPTVLPADLNGFMERVNFQQTQPIFEPVLAPAMSPQRGPLGEVIAPQVTIPKLASQSPTVPALEDSPGIALPTAEPMAPAPSKPTLTLVPKRSIARDGKPETVAPQVDSPARQPVPALTVRPRVDSLSGETAPILDSPVPPKSPLLPLPPKPVEGTSGVQVEPATPGQMSKAPSRSPQITVEPTIVTEGELPKQQLGKAAEQVDGRPQAQGPGEQPQRDLPPATSVAQAKTTASEHPKVQISPAQEAPEQPQVQAPAARGASEQTQVQLRPAQAAPEQPQIQAPVAREASEQTLVQIPPAREASEHSKVHLPVAQTDAPTAALSKAQPEDRPPAATEQGNLPLTSAGTDKPAREQAQQHRPITQDTKSEVVTESGQAQLEATPLPAEPQSPTTRQATPILTQITTKLAEVLPIPLMRDGKLSQAAPSKDLVTAPERAATPTAPVAPVAAAEPAPLMEQQLPIPTGEPTVPQPQQKAASPEAPTVAPETTMRIVQVEGSTEATLEALSPLKKLESFQEVGLKSIELNTKVIQIPVHQPQSPAVTHNSLQGFLDREVSLEGEVPQTEVTVSAREEVATTSLADRDSGSRQKIWVGDFRAKLQTMVEQYRQQSQVKKVMSLELQPEHLGRVEVSLSLDPAQEKVRALIAVHQSEALAPLEKAMVEANSESLNVTLQLQNSTSGNGFNADTQHEHQEHSHTSAGLSEDNAEPESVESAAPRHKDGEIYA